MPRLTAVAVLTLTLLGVLSSSVSASGTPQDDAEYRLLALGYSPHETADIISGRISQKALDTAARMIAVGRGREEAANYLDSQYMLATAARNALTAPPPEVPFASFTAFDTLIDRYANLHQVDAAIVRAIIGAESMFNHAARSTAGAIGLMQLMPATARELGVDPNVPEQNIEGGVRYFAEQLKAFGGVELALVAYNAGPGFAQRYASGKTALYGETREYVRKVMARLR
jgi:soluble lytic murein transglycosylase-like protein